MSLRDRLRGFRGDENPDDADSDPGAAYGDPSGGTVPGSALSGTVELTEFAPRQDGDYHCAARNLYLRFARPAVTETDPGIAEPARGEFTMSGRFSVQRRFSRPVVYTVLVDSATPSDTAAHDASLVVRRTDTGTRSAERLEFTFEPDGS